MKTWIKIWILLLALFVWAEGSVAWLGFRHLDLRFQRFASFLVVPVIQSLLFWGVLEKETLPRGWGQTARRLLESRLAAAFVLIDLGLLAAGAVFHQHPLLSLASPAAVARGYVALRAPAAAVLLAQVGRRWMGSTGQRWIFYLLGAAGALLGLDWATGWLYGLAGEALAGMPLLIRYAAAYGLPLVLALLLLLKAEEVVRGRGFAAANLLVAAAAFTLACGLSLVLATYSRPFLVASWAMTVSALIFLAHSAFWTGVLLLWKECRIR